MVYGGESELPKHLIWLDKYFLRWNAPHQLILQYLLNLAKFDAVQESWDICNVQQFSLLRF